MLLFEVVLVARRHAIAVFPGFSLLAVLKQCRVIHVKRRKAKNTYVQSLQPT